MINFMGKSGEIFPLSRSSVVALLQSQDFFDPHELWELNYWVGPNMWYTRTLRIRQVTIFCYKGPCQLLMLVHKDHER